MFAQSRSCLLVVQLKLVVLLLIQRINLLTAASHGGSSVPVVGPTFGSGLAGVQICAGNTVILNHTLGAVSYTHLTLPTKRIV